MVGWDDVVRGVLFALFAGLTAAIAAVTGPTYDGLLVPEMAPAALYPPLPPTPGAPPTFLTEAASFSAYLVGHVVDPAVAVVAFGVGLVYLTRVLVPRIGAPLESLVPRLVLAVLVANFAVPIAGALLGVAGATYPVVAGFDGGAWQHWQNLDGFGALGFSWDNGVLALVITFALFSMVLILAAAVALRDALLGVLLVVLPIFTLLWPIPTLAPLARRAWILFGELAFLPCLVVIPLELAVGSPNILLLLGYLTVAVSAPSLLSIAGAQLTSVGFPSGGSAVTGGIQRGLAAGSASVNSFLRPLARPGSVKGPAQLLQGVGAAGAAGALPATIPVLAADVLGRSTGHLLRHVPQAVQGLRRRVSGYRPYSLGIRGEEP
jgi:hypothetical protein